MSKITIGQVADQAQVNVETIRYYERRGLIAQPSRPKSGFRRYPEESVERIRFIKRAQDLGFSLEEITELLDLRIEASTACDEVKLQAEAKIADIAEKIKSLQRIKRMLSGLVNACETRTSTTKCPILEALK